MASAWQSSAGARDWARDCQGVEAPIPQVFVQKDTRWELMFRRHQETAHNIGRARRKHRGSKTKNVTSTPGTVRGLGRRSRPAGGGSGHESDGVRQREEGNLGLNNPGANRDLGTGQGWQGGAT